MQGLSSAVLVFALFQAEPSSPVSSAAQVRLSLDETSILPATPTGLTVAIENHGALQLSLPPTLWLIATNEAGQSFVVRSTTLFTEGGGGEPVPEPLQSVAPNASSNLRFDPSLAVAGSRWFMDARLWVPDRYRIRAVLSNHVDPDGSYDAAHALTSNEQTLTVALRSEDDAAVWTWLQAQKWNEQAWLNRPWELASFVMKQHPKSDYALFVALYLPVPSENKPSAAYEDLMTRYAARPFAEQLKLRRIFYYQQSASIAYRRGDLYTATTEAEAGRALASELVANSRSSTVRASAQEFLDHIPSR
jgi:hypothetical protein